MKLSCGRRAAEDPRRYMTGDEFGDLFRVRMTEFHQLAFLLTANTRLAEECFIAGLDDCMSANCVFQEWAHTWARRAIIKNAVRVLMDDTRHEPCLLADHGSGALVSGNVEFAQSKLGAVLALPVFDRLVFVLSVLDRYPDGEVASLLDLSIKDVHQARIRALLKVGSPKWRTREAAAD